MNLKNDSTDRLFKVILNLGSVDECYKLFEDLCTIKEIKDMSQRLDTAFMLYDGESYQKIAEQTGTSSATICRVNKCLNYGDGGYRNAIEKFKQEENKDGKTAS